MVLLVTGEDIMKDAKQGLIEDAIPAFLGHTHGKCRFILKRLPESWIGSQVEIEETFGLMQTEALDMVTSLGEIEINHSDYEFFLCENPDRLYLCFESWHWARINKV
jgi:hypothetical protein